MVKTDKSNEASIIGAKIKELRKRHCLTQEQLSEKIGIDSKQLSRIETGRSMPPLKIANALSKFFKYNFCEILNNPQSIDTIDIPDNYYTQSLNILNSARNEQERIFYLEALKHTQKCIKFDSSSNNQ